MPLIVVVGIEKVAIRMTRELCQGSTNEIRTLPKVIGHREFSDAAAAVCGCQ